MTGVITSLPPVIQQPPGNASANPAGLPGVTYTPAIPTLPQTWTGLQTFQPGTMQFLGSISGNTFLNASPAASGICDLPAVTGTDILLANNTAAVVTNKSIDGLTNTLTNIPIAAFSHTGTGAVVLSNSPVITTPTGIVKGDVGLGNVANVDTSNAANISSGTLPAARLPNPSAATLGGIQSAAAVSHQWINSISTSGVPALSQPAFADISGSVAATQLPNPSATTLGGVESLAAVASKWINTISTSGVPSATQPAFTDISGSVAASQMPALTGDVTTSAGAVATTIALNAVTNVKMAAMSAWTFKGNATSGVATPTDVTIAGLTNKASPAAADLLLLWDVAGSAWKNAAVSGVAGAGAVSSIAGNTGAFTLAYPLGNATNDIRYVGPTNSGQLTYVNTTALSFQAYNGDTIRIGGTVFQIPSSGAGGLAGLGAPTSVFLNGVAAQTLVAATTYYIYAFNNSGTITADFSTTGHIASTTAGNIGTEIKSGDNTRTLIGMVRTGATVVYASDLQTASWFNRRNKFATQAQSLAAAGNSIAINFVTWAEEAFTIGTTGFISNTGTNITVWQDRIDAGNVGVAAQGTISSANAQMTFNSMKFQTASEGNHSYDSNLSGTGGTPTSAGTSSVQIRG